MTQKQKFYGWRVFAGCFLLNVFATALVQGTAALFMNPVINSGMGFDVGTYGLVNMLGAMCGAIGAMIVGPKLQKGNMNIVMMVCAIIAGAAVSLKGVTDNMIVFMVLTGICNIAMMGLTQIPTSMLITAWFVHKRSTILSIAFVGNSLGTVIWPLVFGGIIDGSADGWKLCFILSGIILAAVVIPVSLFLVKKAPALYGQQPYTDPKASTDNKATNKNINWIGVSSKVATKSKAWLYFVISVFCIALMLSGVATNVTNYMVGLGWTNLQGAALLSVYAGISFICMTFVCGPMFDKIGVQKATIVSLVFAILSLVSLLLANSNLMVAYGYALFFALAGGIAKLYASLSVTHLFGPKEYGKIYANINFFFSIGATCGAILTGIIAKSAGYNVAWIVYIGILVVAIIAVILSNKASEELKSKYPNGDEPVAEAK